MPHFRVLAMSAIAAGALALGLGATSASAAQTNFKIPPGTQIDLGPAVCSPGELVFTVVTGHQNSSPDGTHMNATAVGQATTYDANGNVLLTGKGEIWFTTNINQNTIVDEDAVNVKMSDGTGIHLHGSFNMAADGTIRVNRQQAVCS